MQKTAVSLVSCTEHPIEAIYIAWEQSRTEEKMLSASELATKAGFNHTLRTKIDNLVLGVLSSQTPVVEVIHFLFLLEHVPISLREQLVRHRVGHRFGPELGVDQVPGGVDSTFWTQSMRVKDMGRFAGDEAYQIPESIASSDKQLQLDPGEPDYASPADSVKELFKQTEQLYNTLIAAGIPPEDARCVIPLAATHRMVWSTNLAALKHVLKNRSCWIAQLGLWKPVVQQIVRILRKLSPLFGQLAIPPCADKNLCWKGCPFPVDNCARNRREDPGTPCPLWLKHGADGEEGARHTMRMASEREAPYRSQYLQDLIDHTELWGFTVKDMAV